MSDSLRLHRWQPTRLPRPWDSPGKDTGVGCHFLFQSVKVKSGSEVTQSCLTFSDPMDCSLPGSSIHGIFQARVLEWGAIAFSAGRAQSLLNSNVSLPFLLLLTRRGGYSLGSLAGAGSWKCWPEVSATRMRACRGGGSATSGTAGRGAAAAAGTSPGPGLGIRQPLVLMEHWATSSSSMGEGQVILVQILPDPRGRRGIGVSSPAGQQGRTRTPRGPRLFLP